MDQFEDNIEDQQEDDTLDTTEDDSQDSADDQTEDTDGSLNETEILLSMIDAAQTNRASDFKNTFDSMLRLKINDKIEDLKQEVSASLAGGNLSDDETQEESDDIQEELQLSDEELDEFLEGLSDEELESLQEELQNREKKKIDEAGFDNIMNSIKADHATSQDKNAAKWAAERAASAQRLAQTRAKSEANSKSKARELEQKIKSETDSTKKLELQNRLKRVQSNLSEAVKPKYTVKGPEGQHVDTRGSRKKAVNVAKRWFKGAKPSITRTPSRPKLEEGSSGLARLKRLSNSKKSSDKYNTKKHVHKLISGMRRTVKGMRLPEAYNSKFPGWDRITSSISDYDKKQAEIDAKNVEGKKAAAQKTYTKAFTNYMKSQGKNPDGSPIKEACDTRHPTQLDWAREQLKKRRNKILKIKSSGPKANIKEVVSAHSSELPSRSGFSFRKKPQVTMKDRHRDSVEAANTNYAQIVPMVKTITAKGQAQSDNKFRASKPKANIPEPRSARRSYILQRRAERSKKANIKEMDDSTLQKYKQEAERLRKEKLAKVGKNIKKLAKRGYVMPSDDRYDREDEKDNH
jgi:hypothetical protein